MTEQLIGEALIRPFEEMQRARSNIARQQNTEVKTELLPSRFDLQKQGLDLRKQGLDIRRQQLAGAQSQRLRMLSLRLQQLKNMNDFRNKQLMLNQEKFDESTKTEQSKDFGQLLNLILTENPNLGGDQSKAIEALDAIKSGKLSLSTGETIKAPDYSINQAIQTYENSIDKLKENTRKSASQQNFQFALDAIKSANPNLTSDLDAMQAYEAYRSGKMELPDGTPIVPMTETINDAMSGYLKGTTTAKAINASIMTNQADAEQQALLQFIKKYQQGYDTTYFGHSPAQILDSFKNDDASQEKLGKFLAARQFNYDMAQIIQKVNGAQSSLGATHEILDSSKQLIKSEFPRLSGKARDAYLSGVSEGLNTIVNARNKVSISAVAPFLAQNDANNDSSINTLPTQAVASNDITQTDLFKELRKKFPKLSDEKIINMMGG